MKKFEVGDRVSSNATYEVGYVKDIDSDSEVIYVELGDNGFNTRFKPWELTKIRGSR